jgi:hypothetical protein
LNSFNEGVISLSFVGLVLGFEFHSEDSDILGSFVLSLLKAALIVNIDGGKLLHSFVSGFLEVMVTVIPDVSEVIVEILEGGDFVLLVECGGFMFGEFSGLFFSPCLKVHGFVVNVFDDAGVCFEWGWVSVYDYLDHLVEGEGPFVMNPFHNFLVKVADILVENRGHGCLSHLATCKDMGLPVFRRDFNVISLEAV